ncbi:MAG: peptide ABC transporter substrate-binding protein [Pseudomonadales bacterium]
MSESDHPMSPSPAASNLAEPATTQQIPVTERDFNRQAGLRLLGYGLLSVLAVAVLMGLLSVLGSSGGGLNEAVDYEAGTITLALRQEPPQLDSTKATDQVSGMILGHVTEGLLRYDAENRLAPGVAERWDVGEREATFWLRKDARWNDGSSVSAHDFVFAWQKVVDPNNASEYAFFLYPIKNGEAIGNGQLPPSALGVRAIDDHTLHVELEKPIAYFEKLVAFSTYNPVKQSFYESTKGRYGADADTLLYNGPFSIASWVHGASLRMEKNSHYWDKQRARLNTIDFAYVTSDTNATLNLFKANSIAYTSLSTENLPDALNQRFPMQRFMDGSVFYIAFNYREGRVTGNRHLRKAMQLVNDPSELINKVIKIPGNLPGESLFPVWLRGVDGYFRQEYPAPVAERDIKAARRHLELAKQELGVTQIPPLMLLSGEDPLSAKQSEYYQDLFRRTLGLDIRLDKQIFKQRLAKMTSGDYDMVLAGWGPDFDDPLTFGDLMSSWNLNNRGRYNNPELDKWVRVAQNSLEPQVRMDAFGEIQNILFDDAVVLYNYERGQIYVTHPRLQGLVRRAVGSDPDFSNAYILPEQGSS